MALGLLWQRSSEYSGQTPGLPFRRVTAVDVPRMFWHRPNLSLVEAAGVELFHHFENSEVIDSKKRPKRQNRYFRRFEVHGGYTEAAGTGEAKTLTLRSGLHAPNIALAFLAAAVTAALARSVCPVFWKIGARFPFRATGAYLGFNTCPGNNRPGPQFRTFEDSRFRG
jgi:hypothetical protein